MQENFDQLKMITRSWLEGAEMFDALKAVNFGLSWHQGYRKDGVTPEFTHQLSQIQQVRFLAGISKDDQQKIICCIALHDLPEDKRYDITGIYQDFGDEIGLGVERLSKKYFGMNAEQSSERYYFDIGRHKYASVAKGCDRIHNQSSMLGVFSIDKVFLYIETPKAIFFQC